MQMDATEHVGQEMAFHPLHSDIDALAHYKLYDASFSLCVSSAISKFAYIKFYLMTLCKADRIQCYNTAKLHAIAGAISQQHTYNCHDLHARLSVADAKQSKKYFIKASNTETHQL